MLMHKSPSSPDGLLFLLFMQSLRGSQEPWQSHKEEQFFSYNMQSYNP